MNKAAATHGDRVFLPALAGTKAQLLGNPDMPHSYTYIPDTTMRELMPATTRCGGNSSRAAACAPRV